jgi:hypothetical protein
VAFETVKFLGVAYLLCMAWTLRRDKTPLVVDEQRMEKSVSSTDRRSQMAAEKGDQPAMISHLRNAGHWAMTVAKEVGAELVARTLAPLIEH